MNKVYLFGKVILKSKLKYIIEPKLKLYMELIIETISGDRFNCIVNEEMLDKVNALDEFTYVYVVGYGKMENGFRVILQKVYVV